ncbi:hypothetical protein Leryth_022484 [Lithospermum erythrorhizon]|nr:hypothetical protein Leryth_022484 [Lithospermum erythrorhizon]
MIGFLECRILRAIEEESQDITIWENEIAAIYLDIYLLINFLNRGKENANEGLWKQIVHSAYQAEYLIDLYLSSPSERLFSSLSSIIEQVKLIRKNVVTEYPADVKKIDAMSILIQTFPLTIEGVRKVHTFVESVEDVAATSITIYQTRELLLKIIDQVNPSTDDIKNLDDQGLADRLCRSLRKCQYFVVMDDMWDTGLWNFLKRYFPDDRQGSQIIITTGGMRMLLFETKSKMHPLCELTDDESWELLQKRLPKDVLSEYLPEAWKQNCIRIYEVASLDSYSGCQILSNTRKCEQVEGNCWREFTHLVDPQSGLKSCFLYLGAFPEDEEIVVSQLTRLWIAEGFIRDGERELRRSC